MEAISKDTTSHKLNCRGKGVRVVWAAIMVCIYSGRGMKIYHVGQGRYHGCTGTKLVKHDSEGAWLHCGYLSRHIEVQCSNYFLWFPTAARSTPPNTRSCRMILVVLERLTGSYFVGGRDTAMRLVEETEAHVVIGLLLLLLLLLSSRGLLSTTGSSSSAAGGSTTTGSTGWDGGELGRTFLDELVDVLALELGDELV